MHKKYARSRGFTLIELLVVIAIIGLLSTLAVVALNNARSKSRDAKRLSDMKSVQTAFELYFADKNTYPVVASAVTLGDATHNCLDGGGLVATASCTTGTKYMSQVPANPTPAATIQATYQYTSNTAAGAACTTSPCKSYKITFALEEATAGLAGETVLTASPSGVSQ